jgi:hypothetical protein
MNPTKKKLKIRFNIGRRRNVSRHSGLRKRNSRNDYRENKSKHVKFYIACDDGKIKSKSKSIDSGTILMERALTQWYEGDWENLAKIDQDSLAEHPDRAKIMLLSAAGSIQCNDFFGANNKVKLASKWGASQESIAIIFLSGLYNRMGRIYAIKGQKSHAIAFFKKAIDIDYFEGGTKELIRMRINQQFIQLGLHSNLPIDQYIPLSMDPEGGSLSKSAILDKYETLSFIHHKLSPKMYLEIGVHQGKSLALAACEAIGVDPAPQNRVKLDEKRKIFSITSDDFFFDIADEVVRRPIDLVLLDGMPLIEYTLRDFSNIERRASAYTLVVVSGIFPQHKKQAQRTRQGMNWVGDVWKLPQIIAKYRPDLCTIGMAVPADGLLLIAGLDKKNRQLEERFAEIIEEQIHFDTPPVSVMEKTDAVSPDHPKVVALLETLRKARDQQVNGSFLMKSLKAICQID